MSRRNPCAEAIWENGTIADARLLPTGYERLLPPGVQRTVRARRRVLAQRARGRVLDLGGAESHRSLWNRPSVPDVVVLDRRPAEQMSAMVRAAEKFDTVFCAFALVASADADALAAQMLGVLADEGQLLFLEPSLRTGTSRRAQRIVTPGVTLATGWRVGRDVPATLRRAGLSVTDIERHRSTTVHWWLRTLVEGAAHRALEPARS